MIKTEHNNIKKIVDLFSFYYKSVNKMNHFVFRMTPNKKKTITNFINEIKRITNSELQDDYLKMYFDFQFNRWYNRDNPNGKGISIQIEWIVGTKALGLWLKSDKLKSAFIVRKNLKKDVDFKRESKKENYDSLLIGLNLVEERDKKRFFGTNLGFNYCQQTTTLFNHKSEHCAACKNAIKCKDLLFKEYPKIFKKRGYE